MRLRVLLPDQILVDEEVVQVTAEAENGSFSMLPRHVDFVAALVPGIFSYRKEDGAEEFLALDEGILVKCGQDVRVSIVTAVRGNQLGELRDMIHARIENASEHERAARDAMNKLEVDLIRRLMEMG